MKHNAKSEIILSPSLGRDETIATLSRRFSRPLAFLDTEYCDTSEPQVTPVAASIKGRPHKPPMKFALVSASGRAEFKAFLEQIRSTHIIVAWNWLAEASCLFALGIDPFQFRKGDLWVEWKQLQYNNHKYQYGRMLRNGCEFVSVPPRGRSLPTVSNEKVGHSLAAALYHQEGIDIDSDEKTRMRNLIIGGPPFGPEQMVQILNYCAGDTEYLPYMAARIVEANPHLTEDVFHNRAEYVCACAAMERRGIPLDMDAIGHLSRNVEPAQKELIRELNREVYPFYRWDAKNGKFIQDYDRFLHLVDTRGFRSQWPISDNGKLKRDEDTLKKFANAIPEVGKLIRSKSRVAHLNWFRPEANSRIMSRIGNDGRLRPFLNPFGTQTQRNAPPASHFIFAMSSWLRVLIRSHLETGGILAKDWSSQEFAIAAALSGDKNMMRAYRSGDAYLGFLKLVGMIPQDAKRADYANLRDAAKSSILGIQFSMGAQSLTEKIAVDAHRAPIPGEGRLWITRHQEAFPEFWRWRKQVARMYEKKNPLYTRNGWYMWCDNPSILSAGNFPIQGNGSAINQIATVDAAKRGLPLISNLHDAEYAECIEAMRREVDAELTECMDAAVKQVLRGAIDIRIGTEWHPNTEDWVEPKGRESYVLLKRFLKEDGSEFL